MNENEKLQTEKPTEIRKKNFKAHSLIFLAAIIILIVLGWALPPALHMKESVVERYLMGGFAVFLAAFLFWLK